MISNIIYTVFGLCLLAIGMYWGSILSKSSKTSTNIKVTPEEKESDLSLVYESLDNYIMTELHKFTTKDFKFDDNCDIKLLSMNSYRTLIRCLLHPGQIMTIELLDGTTESRTLFSIFINKVYLKYVSETPAHIKALVFKYFSGYTTEEYFMDKKKRPEPSALPFVTNYVRNYLWCRYEENEENEQKILDMVRAGENVFLDDTTTDDLEKALQTTVRIVKSSGMSFVRCYTKDYESTSFSNEYNKYEMD